MTDAASSHVEAPGIPPKRLAASAVPNRSRKRVVRNYEGRIDPPRRVLTREEIREVHGCGRFKGFDAEPHLLERLESLVEKQAAFELDYSYLISNAATSMKLRARRIVWCEHLVDLMLKEFKLENGQECVDVAIWMIDAYLCKKRPDTFQNKMIIDAIIATVTIVTKVHNVTYICFAESMSLTENTMTKKDVKLTEADILQTLDWKLFPPLVTTGIEHLGAILGCPESYIDAAKERWYTCRVCIDTTKFSPVVLAAAALMGYATKTRSSCVRYTFDEEEAAYLSHSTKDAVRRANALLVAIEKEEAVRLQKQSEKRRKEESKEVSTAQIGKKKRKKTDVDVASTA